MPTNREILFILKAQNQAAAGIRAFATDIRNAANQAQQALNQVGASSTRSMQAVTQSTGKAVGGLKAITVAAAEAKAAVASVGPVKPPAVGSRGGSSTIVPGGGGGGGRGVVEEEGRGGLLGLLGGLPHEFSALESITHHVTGIFGQLVTAGGTLVGIMVGLEGFKRFAEFEQAIATIKAIRGTSPEDEQRLRSSAQDLGSGKIGSFGPVEVSQGMEVLSRTGQGATEVINNITAAMHLAAATGRDLQDSTNDLARILSEFGIDSTRAGDAVDVLTSGTTAAHLRMEDLAVSMRQVGPVAKGLGLSFNEVVAAIGVLSDNGRRGTQGGSDLREVLLKLLNASEKAKGAASSMGFKMKDLTPTQTLLGLVEKLQKGGLDVSRSARLFGTEHATAGVILSQNIAKLKTILQTTQNSAGFSARMAEIESDTPLRALDRIKNAAENVAHDIGNASHSAITFTLDVIGQAINQLRGLPAGFDQVGQAAQTATLAVKALGGAIAFLVTAATISAVLSNPYVALASAIVAVTTYVYSLRNELITFNGETVQLGALGQAAWEMFRDSASDAWEAMKTILMGIASGADAIYEKISAVAAAVSKSFVPAWQEIQDGATLACAYLQDVWANLPQFFSNVAHDAGTALVNGLKVGVNLAAGLVNDLLAKINSVGGKIGITVPQLPTMDYGKYASQGGNGEQTVITAARTAAQTVLAARQADRSNQDAPLTGSVPGALDEAAKVIEGSNFGHRLGELSDALAKRTKEIQDANDKARALQDKVRMPGPVAGYTGNSNFDRSKPVGLDQLDPDATKSRGGGGGRSRAAKQSPEDKASENADTYIEKQNDGLAKQLQLAGLVGKERERMSAIMDVQNHLSEIDNLSADKRNQLLDTFKSKYDELQAAISAKQSVFAGINAGLKTYAESAGDYFKNAQQLGQDVFNNIEEALSNFVSTGKLNIRSLVSTILNEFVRLLVIKPLLAELDKTLTGVLGGGGPLISLLGLGGGASLATAGIGGIGRNAGGTDSWRGGLTWVGEKGPELINAARGAQIIPSNASLKASIMANSMGGNRSSGNSSVFAPSVTNTINVQGSSGDSGKDAAYAKMMQDHLNAAMDAKIEQWASNQMRPGGMLTRKRI